MCRQTYLEGKDRSSCYLYFCEDCLSHWSDRARKKALKSPLVAEKREVKGAGAYPHAERNHLKCARAAWDHISALVFQHLFLENNTYLGKEHSSGWSRVSAPIDKCTFKHHILSWMCYHRWPHGTYRCSRRQGGGVLEWSINGSC